MAETELVPKTDEPVEASPADITPAVADDEPGAGCDVCMPPYKLVGADAYDYKYLCMPSMPWSKGGVEPPQFLAKDEKLPLMLALIMGLQHALAMVAGIATSGGMLIAGDACFPWQWDSEMCESREYMVSAAWITSGILTIIQVFRAKILGTPYYLGTGLISVMGTSFTFLPIAREMVIAEIRDAQSKGKCTGTGFPFDCKGYGKEGYGKFLGTAMVASLFECVIAMMPTKIRKRLFPTVVTGCAVMLIGVSLIGAGVKYVGGGVFCGENDLSRSAAFDPPQPQPCNENGNVVLYFGAPEYVGLAFSVIAMSVFLQFFGSPFLKSTFLFWGLMFGCFVAGISSHEAGPLDKTLDFSTSGGKVSASIVDAVEGRQYKYFNDYRIRNAPFFTFLWAKTFPLGFDINYFWVILIGFYVSSAETVGDVTMSCLYSKLPVTGDDFESRVQGGLLADGVNSFLATLFTSPPNTTFSQNNGVISLTGCASRAAGFACAFWLILFGIFGKLGAAFTSIPICVVGGLVLQCFTSVFVSGMVIATKHVTRRNQFIIMMSMALGIGVAMEPNLFEGGGGAGFFGQNLKHNYGFWPRSKVCNKFPTDDTGAIVKTCTNKNGACCLEYDDEDDGARTLALIMLKTPYAIGTTVALLLHLLLPEDVDAEEVFESTAASKAGDFKTVEDEAVEA